MIASNPHPSAALPTLPPKRKRGGQKGNRNAVKHGFYTHSFHKRETLRLSADIQGDLDGERDLMRVLILRTTEDLTNNPQMPPELRLSYMRAITLAVGRLESIRRTQKAVNEKASDLDKALAELKYLKWDQD